MQEASWCVHMGADTVEVERAYVYMIDWRGRSFMDAAGLTPALQRAGVLVDGSLRVTRVQPDGRAQSPVINIKVCPSGAAAPRASRTALRCAAQPGQLPTFQPDPARLRLCI